MFIRCILLVVACLMLSGCGLERPQLRNPGPIYYQQQRAVIHDPYVDNDAGPEVVGGRPRDYENPLPEPVRAKLWSTWNGY